MSGTTVILLRSTDTSAPRLSGTIGDLTTLLDACLVNGYNSRTLTSITRSGTTATATFTAHGYAVDGLTKIAISGADQADYNGTFIPFNITANTFDFTVANSPVTPATGTITSKVPPLGWTKAFTGTNLGAYRSSESTGSKLYLRVDDTTTNTARLRGYEAMTDINTGVNAFPTDGQISGGLWFSKSDLASTASRPWVLVGDGYEFHIFYGTNSTSYPNIFRQFHFGDPVSEMASDPFGCLIYGDIASALSDPAGSQTTNQLTTSVSVAIAQSGHFYARNYTQIGTSAPANKHGNYTLGGYYIGAAAALQYPAPDNNGLYIAPIFVADGLVIRGQLKGTYQPLHTRPLGHGALVPVGISPISRRLYSIATAYSGTTTGETHIDIDGPWR